MGGLTHDILHLYRANTLLCIPPADAEATAADIVAASAEQGRRLSSPKVFYASSVSAPGEEKRSTTFPSRTQQSRPPLQQADARAPQSQRRAPAYPGGPPPAEQAALPWHEGEARSLAAGEIKYLQGNLLQARRDLINLHTQLDQKERKLSASLLSIKLFWGPELEKERKLRLMGEAATFRRTAPVSCGSL